MVNQGQTVYVLGDELVQCTVGFVDSSAWTAAHCGPPGAPVFSSPDLSTQVGVFWPSERFRVEDQWPVNDLGFIELSDAPGENVLSGSERIYPQVGDVLCTVTECGPMVGARGENIYVAITGERGESGGPVWAEGGGFVGVVSMGGFSFTDPITGESIPLLVATTDDEGTSAPQQSDHDQVITDYLRFLHGDVFLPPGQEATMATPSQRPVEVSFAPAPEAPAPPLPETSFPWVFAAILVVMTILAVIVRKVKA